MDNKKETKKTNKNLVILITAIVVSLGAGFFGGLEYQKSKKVNNFGNNPPGLQQGTTTRNGSGIKNGNPGGSQPVSGEITSVDNGSLTVKTQDGGSKIVVLSSTTKINLSTEGSVSDLKAGDNIMVIGTTGTDGTVTATTVSIGATLLGVPGNQPPQGN